MDTRELMNVEEARERLGISRASIYEAINSGKLQTVTVAGKRFLRRSSVEKYQPRNYPKKPDGKEVGES